MKEMLIKAKAEKLLEGLKKAGLAMPHMKDQGKHILRAKYYPYNLPHNPTPLYILKKIYSIKIK